MKPPVDAPTSRAPRPAHETSNASSAPIEIPLSTGGSASFARITYHASSPLKALRAALPDAEVSFVDGRNLNATLDAARRADLAIVFATQWTTEADDVPDLRLPNQQDALIAAIAAAQPHTVAVLETGGPVLMPWLDHVPAVVQAWYPGQRGGEAIAAVLTGAANPSGRLPITFPAAASQAPRSTPVGLDLLHARDAAGDPKVPLPRFEVDYPEGADVGYRWYQKTKATPLFPFGYGLSYTGFHYAGLQVSGTKVRFTVTNTGRRAGTDVPQVYVSAADETGTTTRRLAGWARVALAPGETRTVSVTLDPRVAAIWDEAGHRWSVPASPLPLVVSRSATDPVLSGAVTLPAPR